MHRYVVTSTVVDYGPFIERNRRDEGPGHGVVDLADRLEAEVVEPDFDNISKVGSSFGSTRRFSRALGNRAIAGLSLEGR